MSDTSNQTGQDTQGVQDFTMPVQNLGFQRRRFLGFSPELSSKEQASLRQSLGIYVSPRGAVPQYITQPVIYDDKGRVLGLQYDLQQDPYVVTRELDKLSTAERIRIAQELKRVGFYGEKKVSQALLNGYGWSADDEQAWAKLLDISNNAQRRWQDTFGMLGSFASLAGTGTTIRVTSDEDAAAYTREVFLSELGRMPTRREMAEAANFIRTRERQAYAAGQQMPSTAVVAQSFAQKADPTARTVYGLGNAISLAMQALGQ